MWGRICERNFSARRRCPCCFFFAGLFRRCVRVCVGEANEVIRMEMPVEGFARGGL